MNNNSLQVGQPAPDFEVKGHNDEKVKLSELRGQKVIVAFHPLAFTNVCSQQMLDLELNQEKFAEKNVKAVAINVDQPNAKKAWAQSLGIKKTPLLSDFWPHGEIARSYGVWDEKNGISKRAVFVVDEEGKVAWKKEYAGGQVPDIEEIVAAL